MRNLVLSGLLVFVGLTSLAFADSIRVRFSQPIPRGGYAAAVGSKVTLDLPADNGLHSGIFLGRLVNQDASLHSFMLLDEQTRTVYFTEGGDVQINDKGLETILNPYEQQGGTCTAYAMDHFMLQMSFSGFQGNGELEAQVSTEKGRADLLVDAVNQYYLVLQHRFSIRGIMNQYGKRFGFSCREKIFQDAPAAHEFIRQQLSAGAPFLISFNTGPEMVKSPFALVEFGKTGKLDQRLWVPRKIGQRNSGGHTVVAVALFEFAGRQELLILDSDWNQPRVWDLNKYLNSKTAIDEIEFVTCSLTRH